MIIYQIICVEEFSLKKSGFYYILCKDYYICISCYQENKITKEEFKKQYLEIKKKDQNHGLFVIAENKSESKEEFTTKKKDKKEEKKRNK